MFSLIGKVAIVSGASSGIGRAAAKLFAAQGAKLVITARRRIELEALIGEIETDGGEAIAVAGDVRDEAHHAALVDLAERRFGGLDIAFNNAGVVGTLAPLAQLTAEDWHTVMETNLTGAFFAARHQVPALQKRGSGSLIFTSSFVGHTAGIPGMAAYAATKAGLIGLTQALAAELGAEGIRVNALLPGGTDTPAATFRTPEERAFVEGFHALKRIARPQEIAQAALYLASDASSFTTGTALLADGGVSISKT
ncbi:SDR family oxidoreductase [Nitratireductor sp. ZSWI3]|uniref:SDR family oxidoreductase n=1 Tax=Nitratireductor sp. ZSWI3 TaxID=2966359 RepID=UPI0021501ECF|nr:SDR family oxidoreductase [Nitratireductor sp. ZSWI3]MCR4264945.1 SDR family oxidoreductase [Nitratireductor sp. ZSWI3]